jgi:Uri superfamily endonuclease
VIDDSVTPGSNYGKRRLHGHSRRTPCVRTKGRPTVIEASVLCSMVPREPGTYVLVMCLETPSQVTVGKLGAFRLSPGWYSYVGSALGPGGLAARLARHRRSRKRRHWHIDYLADQVKITEIWWMASGDRAECAWARALNRLSDTRIPVPGFGSSDCQCPSHLLYSPHSVVLSTMIAQLTSPDAPEETVHGVSIERLVTDDLAPMSVRYREGTYGSENVPGPHT